MGRIDRFLHPKMRDPKRRGEWVEAAFQAKALGQGLSVCKPCGDSDPFDFVVYNVRRSMNRVQVKSAWLRYARRYKVDNPDNKKFKRSDFDFLVVALPDADIWYVIPVDAVHDLKAVCFYPHHQNSRGRFEKYREAWHLLTGDEPGAWKRYQRFTIHAGTE